MAKSRTRPKAIAGLYAITPDMADTEKLCELVEACLQGGASVVQYRNKIASPALREQQARALLLICRKHGVPLIINDFVHLCLAVGADGVHLGGDDGSLIEARAQLGNGKLLGASCYNRYELALQARFMKADYVAFGACFSSVTKPAAADAPVELFAKAAREIGLPIVAIGGITPENASQLVQSGADSIAVVSALFSASDVVQTARKFSQLFKQENSYDITQSAVI